MKLTMTVRTNQPGRTRNLEHVVEWLPTGWLVRQIRVGGLCDKGGRPGLFEALRHNAIHFPQEEHVEHAFELLWDHIKNGIKDRGADAAINEADAQRRLDQIGEWLSACEAACPDWCR